MKFLYLLLLFALTTFAAKAQTPDISFPGGLDSLYKSLQQVRYPFSCLENNITGCGSFVLKMDTSTEKLVIYNKPDSLAGPFIEVVTRALKNLPQWNIQSIKKRLCNTTVIFPVCFKIDSSMNGSVDGKTILNSYTYNKTSKISTKETLYLDTLVVSGIRHIQN